MDRRRLSPIPLRDGRSVDTGINLGLRRGGFRPGRQGIQSRRRIDGAAGQCHWRAFHVHGAIAYVHEKAYLSQPNFQRYLAKRREILEKKEKRTIRLME